MEKVEDKDNATEMPFANGVDPSAQLRADAALGARVRAAMEKAGPRAWMFDNNYDRTDMVRRKAAMEAGGLRIAAYTVYNPEKGEDGPLQFHMTYNNMVVGIMGESMAKLFCHFIERNAGGWEGAAPGPGNLLVLAAGVQDLAESLLAEELEEGKRDPDAALAAMLTPSRLSRLTEEVSRLTSSVSIAKGFVPPKVVEELKDAWLQVMQDSNPGTWGRMTAAVKEVAEQAELPAADTADTAARVASIRKDDLSRLLDKYAAALVLELESIQDSELRDSALQELKEGAEGLLKAAGLL